MSRLLIKYKKMIRLSTIFLGIMFIFFAAQAKTNPNIIIIFADDEGFNDLSIYGATDIQTPNMDRLAKEGLKFNNFYASSPICTPSRASLLTGRYPQRVGLSKVLHPHHKKGLKKEEFTIAELLKKQNYKTAIIGKWHLGHRKEFLPTQHGFDEFYGIPYSHDMKPLFFMKNEERLKGKPDIRLLTKNYTEKAIEFIDRNSKRPFFLYLAHSMPHIPLATSSKYIGKSLKGKYGDVIEELDWSVGKIRDRLKSNKLENNTLIILTSDNGPWTTKGDQGGSAMPFRGGKHSTWEGGMRVPGIFWWPDKIPAGNTTHEMGVLFDVLPTIADIVDYPLTHKVDGQSLLPLLLNPNSEIQSERPLLYYKYESLKAIRLGKWKYHFSGKLYDLSQDLSERNNLSKKYPSVIKKLKKVANIIDSDIKGNPHIHGGKK